MHKKFPLLIPLFAALILTACFHNPPKGTERFNIDEETSTDVDTTDTEYGQSFTEYNDKTTSEKTDITTDKPAAAKTAPKNIDVDFIEPKILATDTLLSNELKKQILESYDQHYSSKDETQQWNYIKDLLKFYEVGTIKKAPYKDWTLVLLVGQCEGMCFKPDIYRFAWNKKTGKLIALMRHSDNTEYIQPLIEPLLVSSDNGTTLTDFQAPEGLLIPNSKNQSIRLKQAYSDFQPGNLGKLAFSDSNFGNFYFNSDDTDISCLYLLHPDGTVSRYAYEPYFFEESGYSIKWDDGSKDSGIASTYRYSSGGCGFADGCYPLKNFEKEEGNLERIGITDSKVEIFAIKDPEKLAENTILKQALDTAYETYKSQNPDASMRDFLKIKPVVFWQDPFDRWSVLIHNESSFAAECGKPVIYLYPETAIDVSVQVGIEKLTESIPQYGEQGWYVRAEPNGQITNYKDGQTYPYLFWEGEKNGDTPIERGFVIHRDELSKFLKTSLKKLGLNKQESRDFREYWVDRMLKNDEPYFFISFIGTRDFDKIAPLTITPKPDTTIRVFVYFKPITAPFTPSPQYLKTIPRKGFTVIEWGGTEVK